MIKKIFCLFLSLSCISLAYAGPGNTYVTVTNNTNEYIKIRANLTTPDRAFHDWGAFSGTLAPYETKQVLWFSRNVKLTQYYQFDLIATHPSYPGFPTTVTFIEKGKVVYGSQIVSLLTLPNQRPQKILEKETLKTFSTNMWGGNYEVYARTWLPLGNFFNNYQIVINKPENNSVNTSSNQTLSVLTYNTQLMPFYTNAVDDLNQPKIRVNDIPPKINTYDVVIFEELFDRDLRNTMIKNMQANFPYHTHVVGENTSKTLTGGVMIFSKWPITKENETIYQASAGSDSLAAKGALYAAINKNGKIYHVFGTHLQADSADDDVRVRVKQLEQLENFIEQLNIPATEPLLIGGDFNIDQFGNEFNNLLNILHVSLLNNPGYQYSFDGTTNTMSTDKSRIRIDYIFSSDLYVKPKSAFNKVFVLRDLNNEKMWPKFDLSDHFPVLGYFDFSA